MSFFRNAANLIDSNSINSDRSHSLFLATTNGKDASTRKKRASKCLTALYKDSQRKQLVCFYKVEKITTMFPTWEVKNQGCGAIEKLSLLQGLP